VLIFDLGGTRVKIFDTRRKKVWQVVITSGLLEHMEVINESGYAMWWSEVIGQVAAKNQEAIILIGEDVSFCKEITNVKEAVNFWPEVPLSEQVIMTKEIRLPGKLLAVAMDKRIYEIPAKVLAEHRSKVLAVAVGFGLVVTCPAEGWGWKELKKVESLVRLKLVNNWLERQVVVREKNVGQRKKVSWLSIVELLMIPGLVVWLGMALRGQQTNTLQPTPTLSQIEPTSVPSPTTEPIVTQPLDVATLKVLILNGSGKTGEASKMMDYLKGLGYLNVDTGNATEAASAGITIEASDTIGQRVVDDLEEGYTTAQVKIKNGENFDYDVVVIIGRE
jgi:hypothetical protein